VLECQYQTKQRVKSAPATLATQLALHISMNAKPPLPIWLLALLTCFSATSNGQIARAARYDGRLTVTVLDEQSREPLPVRMELRDARGRTVRVRPEGAQALPDGIYFEGTIVLELRRGNYTFLIEAGPEFRTRPGRFEASHRSEGAQEVTLLRRVDMQSEGWWAGDLDVQLPLQAADLAMRARGVDIAAITTATNMRGKFKQLQSPAGFSRSPLQRPLFGPWASMDHRRGGGLLLIGGETPVDVSKLAANEPSLPSLRAAREAGATAVALTPFGWDLPLWLASGEVSSIQLIHRHALRTGVVDNEGWGRPRDKRLFSGATGNARYSEHIYHHVLNCGLRIAPAAGSGAGANVNPIGENRVYVHCGDQCTRESWLEGLRQGRVSITNGPLLRTQVEGNPPGHVFRLENGEMHEFQIGLNLAFYDQHRVDYLEIVQNGQVAHEIRLDELAQRNGRLPPVRFDESGWFLVRAVTDKPGVYQYATTGPYYVESGYRSRISRESVQYFLDWLDASAVKFANNPEQLAAIEAARPYWRDLAEQANAP